jgi:hypothetical protein
MTFSSNALVAFAVLVAIGAAPLSAASAASVDRAFAAAVAKVLAGVHNSFLDSLSAADKRAFIACAQRVMNAAPQARKEYVLAAKNAAEMRERFDKIALDNRAKLKQQISSECAA